MTKLTTKQILIASFKGGVGKTTTAVNLAAFLSENGATVLIDCDPNRSATKLNGRGEGLPYRVMSQQQAITAMQKERFSFIVIDSAARPATTELADYADGADLIVIPMAPSIDDLDPTLETVAALKELGFDNYRLLLSSVPPKPSKEGKTMLKELQGEGYHVFEAGIRRSAGIPQAALKGLPVRDLVGNYRLAWRDYTKIGEIILAILEVEPTK